jgi:RNA polymerase sigma-70 factor (ECF subfamily)
VSEADPADAGADVRLPAPGETGGAGGPRSAPAEGEFAGFYREFVPVLVGFLVWQGASAAVAADLAQETMIEAYRQWPRVQHPRAWTRRVASRSLVRHVARVEEAPVGTVPEAGALVRSPDELAEWENRHEILRLLACLPPRQRQVLAWSVDGHTPAEIAEELGIDPATVRANLLKARRTVARLMRTGEEDS